MFSEDESEDESYSWQWFGFDGNDSGGSIRSSLFLRQFFIRIDSKYDDTKGEQIMGYILMIISLVATGFIFTVE